MAVAGGVRSFHVDEGGEVGADGKTAYERSRGKTARLPWVEFGEGVLWKRRREGGPLGKLTCMWDDGIFLRVKGSTGEMIVGDDKGVWRTRTIRRKPEAEVEPGEHWKNRRCAMEDDERGRGRWRRPGGDHHGQGLP